jgi:hypothetical protein
MPEATGPTKYRGFTLDADTNARGEWIGMIDGDEITAGPQRSKREALREARKSVNRKLGKSEPKVRRTVETDEGYFDRLRDEIRDDS